MKVPPQNSSPQHRRARVAAKTNGGERSVRSTPGESKRERAQMNSQFSRSDSNNQSSDRSEVNCRFGSDVGSTLDERPSFTSFYPDQCASSPRPHACPFPYPYAHMNMWPQPRYPGFAGCPDGYQYYGAPYYSYPGSPVWMPQIPFYGCESFNSGNGSAHGCKQDKSIKVININGVAESTARTISNIVDSATQDSGMAVPESQRVRNDSLDSRHSRPARFAYDIENKPRTFKTNQDFDSKRSNALYEYQPEASRTVRCNNPSIKCANRPVVCDCCSMSCVRCGSFDACQRAVPVPVKQEAETIYIQPHQDQAIPIGPAASVAPLGKEDSNPTNPVSDNSKISIFERNLASATRSNSSFDTLNPQSCQVIPQPEKQIAHRENSLETQIIENIPKASSPCIPQQLENNIDTPAELTSSSSCPIAASAPDEKSIESGNASTNQLAIRPSLQLCSDCSLESTAAKQIQQPPNAETSPQVLEAPETVNKPLFLSCQTFNTLKEKDADDPNLSSLIDEIDAKFQLARSNTINKVSHNTLRLPSHLSFSSSGSLTENAIVPVTHQTQEPFLKNAKSSSYIPPKSDASAEDVVSSIQSFSSEKQITTQTNTKPINSGTINPNTLKEYALPASFAAPERKTSVEKRKQAVSNFLQVVKQAVDEEPNSANGRDIQIKIINQPKATVNPIASKNDFDIASEQHGTIKHANSFVQRALSDD